MISVIIPTRDRADLLKLALRSLAKQALPPAEVIVIDNGSRDNTREVAEQSPITVRYFYDESPGLHRGRNFGAREAKSDILTYLDDDVECFPTLLSTMARAFEQNPDIALIGGKCLPRHHVTELPPWFVRMWMPNAEGERTLWYLSLCDFGEHPRLVCPYCVIGCNFSIRRSVLLEAKGFHPDNVPSGCKRFRGDGETYVSHFVEANGHKALYHPDASIYHHVTCNRMNFDYMCRRAYDQGIFDSYTRIRTAQGLAGHLQAPSDGSLWKRVRKMTLRQIAGAAHRRLVRLARDEWQTRMEAAYDKGFAFHQQAVRDSKSLLEWVLRPNYWDAHIEASEK